MLTSYVPLTLLEKTRILVEIFIGDWIQSWLTNSDPQYGLLLWYYQFVRAETCWSLGFSFIILSFIVYAWWQSSYVHEGEYYELMSVSFPNESKEWWYENLSELAILVTYFLYFSFVQLPYFWKPRKYSFIWGGYRKTAVTKWLIGERTYNPIAYLLSTKYRYRWTVWHVNFLDVTRWTLDELRSVEQLRSVKQAKTRDGNGWYFKLGRPTNFWDRTKYYFRVGIPNAMRSPTKMRALKIKRQPLFLSAPFQYVYIAIKKKSKYVRYANPILARRQRKRIARYYKRYSKKLKKRLWRRSKLARKAYWASRKRKYRRVLLKSLKFVGINVKRLNFNLCRTHTKYFNRGRLFIRYFRNVRLKKNLLPIQKELQRHILKRGRHFQVVYRVRPRLRRVRRALYTNRRRFRRRTFYINRPHWHPWYWKKYYNRSKKDDMRTHGALSANDISANARLFPILFLLACVNCYCWEEDEWDMYEEEFEDWDLEYDQEMGEVNFEDMDMEQDEDLLTLKRKPSDTFEAIRFSEIKQEIRDGDALSRQADRLNDDDYDEEDIVVEEEDIDTDLLMLGVDYWAAIFEYFNDPVPFTQEVRQLHMTKGVDMPPAWGYLQEASTLHRNLFDRVGAMIYSYYFHNHVDLGDGVASADYWWDSEPKSWRHDGQPRDYLSLAGADWKTFNDWYLYEYRLKKKENDPDFYAAILEVDAKTRKTRPHFHGMAFSRGYGYVPKRDEGLYFKKIVESLTEDRRQLLFEYMDKVSERDARGEFIADDDYLTFEDGKYNPFTNKFSKPQK